MGPQLAALGVLAVCTLYFVVVLNPTAQVRFKMATDAEERARVKAALRDNDRPLQQAFTKELLKPLPRPRGDQTANGRVVPGLTDDAAARR